MRRTAFDTSGARSRKWNGSSRSPADGKPVCIELLDPAGHLDLLPVVAERYELDGEALLAAAQAALAAPDRLVELKLSAVLVA
jgi:hypothetical protein